MSYPFLGQVLTSFTNGMLGTNYKVPGKGTIPAIAASGKAVAHAVKTFQKKQQKQSYGLQHHHWNQQKLYRNHSENP